MVSNDATFKSTTKHHVLILVIYSTHRIDGNFKYIQLGETACSGTVHIMKKLGENLLNM